VKILQKVTATRLAGDKNEDINMSILIVATPGTPEGPCRGSCDHRKCHLLREIAQERCAHCGGHLGFGTKITGDPSMHLRCAQAIAATAHDPIHAPVHHGHPLSEHHNIKQ